MKPSKVSSSNLSSTGRGRINDFTSTVRTVNFAPSYTLMTKKEGREKEKLKMFEPQAFRAALLF